MPLPKNSKDARDRAEASFAKKEHQARESQKAVPAYEAEGRAVSEKTARLKALRLAKEESDRKAEVNKVRVTPTKKPQTPHPK